MEILDKLCVLADAAKYDVACTSSGTDRAGKRNSIGSAVSGGICHSFSADGRCISLLKVLMTNACIYDCKYCINRRSNDTRRAAFTPKELADLTIAFYRRNYIEGLFLSSGIVRNPDYTCEQMIEVLRLLRDEHRFRGYIHVKAIPGADDALIKRLGMLADRMSINIELPSKQSLQLLAPDKSKQDILRPMGLVHRGIQAGKEAMSRRQAPRFVPAGQSTQMIIGATPDTDYKILCLTQALYTKYRLKRVFYSAYTPINAHALLPALGTKPPLLREHRLYQADWLLRFYGFSAQELLDEQHQNFNPYLDPKCNWALNHLDIFPIEINRAEYELLLRVPGIGVKSARRILAARKAGGLRAEALQKIGVVSKRAKYFITCDGKPMADTTITPNNVFDALVSARCAKLHAKACSGQLSMFEPSRLLWEDVRQSLTGEL